MTRYSAIIAAALVLAGAAEAAAQDIAARVRQVQNGTVRLTFASKPGVCGDGESYIATRGWGPDSGERRTIFRQSSSSFSITSGDDDWRELRNCMEGPLRVALEVANGRVADVHSYVGKQWPAGQPAETVGARSAVAFLLQVAQTSDARAGKHALTAVVLADSVQPAPELLRIANDRRVPQETRKSAIFWAGQIGDPATVARIAGLIDDDNEEIAKSAVFAISQQKNEAAARTLLTAARNTSLSTGVRKSAVFWLGQAASDRATEGLKAMANDANSEVKKSAVFALSQMKTEKSLDALIELARTSKDREVRKSALFWLAQSSEPRALALFEEILLKK